MKYLSFEVLDNNDALIEALPATLTGAGHYRAGKDTAMITAYVPTVPVDKDGNPTGVDFVNDTIGEVMATIPVDPETLTAVMELTSLHPITVRLRVGPPTQSGLNCTEVVFFED